MTPMDASVEALAEMALDHWPGIIGKPRLVMHRENSVFRVETESGPAALRLHRAGYHAPEAIRSELDWMAHLASSGLSVPLPMPARDGRRLVEIELAGAPARCADLLSWLDGEPLGRTGVLFTRPVAETTAHFRELGAALARLHAVSDAWTPPAGFSRHAWDRDGLVGDEPFWGRFWALPEIDTEQAEFLLATRDRVRADLDAFIRTRPDFGLIHADPVRENVLVHGGGVALIDFDDSGFGFRLFDIATALIKNRHEPHFAAFQAALLAGYESQRNLADAERDALPLFMLLRALTYLGWAEARRDEPGMAERRRRLLAEAFDLAHAYRVRA